MYVRKYVCMYVCINLLIHTNIQLYMFKHDYTRYIYTCSVYMATAHGLSLPLAARKSRSSILAARREATKSGLSLPFGTYLPSPKWGSEKGVRPPNQLELHLFMSRLSHSKMIFSPDLPFRIPLQGTVKQANYPQPTGRRQAHKTTTNHASVTTHSKT